MLLKEIYLNPQDFETAGSFPTADIKAQTDGENLTVNHSYSVVTPDEDKKEYMVTIRASSLNSWRKKLETLTGKSFPWAEVLLAVASLGAGSILSALISDVALSTCKGKFFYIFLLPITTAVIVAYCFVRSISNTSADEVASSVLSDMPNMNSSEPNKQ